MNELIKELVRQAGGHFSTHILTSYPAQHRESIQLWDQNIEKFAELIVRECVQSIEKTIETNCDNGYEKMGCEFAITDMLEHFGVKE